MLVSAIQQCESVLSLQISLPSWAFLCYRQQPPPSLSVLHMVMYVSTLLSQFIPWGFFLRWCNVLRLKMVLFAQFCEYTKNHWKTLNGWSCMVCELYLNTAITKIYIYIHTHTHTKNFLHSYILYAYTLLSQLHSDFISSSFPSTLGPSNSKSCIFPPFHLSTKTNYIQRWV